MQDLRLAVSSERVLPGEAYVGDTPLLRSHAGTQPDLFLRWNEIPLGASSIDIVVHLHGFSQEGRAMSLTEKMMRSGLDLSRRMRPTLAMLPRGNWIRHTYYDFPALLCGGIDRLVDYGLQRFSTAITRAAPGASHEFGLDRFILSAHSGGGMPAVDAIAGAGRPPDEFFAFDGLYGRDPAGGNPMGGLEIIDRWLGRRLALEPKRQGALRVIYIEGQTGPFSRQVAALISRRVAEADPALSEALSRRYRVDVSAVQHSQIARHCQPLLLARSDARFEWSP